MTMPLYDSTKHLIWTYFIAVLYNGDWTKVNLIRPFPKDQTPMIDVNLCVH